MGNNQSLICSCYLSNKRKCKCCEVKYCGKCRREKHTGQLHRHQTKCCKQKIPERNARTSTCACICQYCDLPDLERAFAPTQVICQTCALKISKGHTHQNCCLYHHSCTCKYCNIEVYQTSYRNPKTACQDCAKKNKLINCLTCGHWGKSNEEHYCQCLVCKIYQYNDLGTFNKPMCWLCSYPSYHSTDNKPSENVGSTGPLDIVVLYGC